MKLTLPISLLALLGLPAQGATLIDFDGLEDSDIVTTQFAGLTFQNAIVLSSGISLNELEFPPASGSNVVSDNGGPITIDFAAPITAFHGAFTYVYNVGCVGLGCGGVTLAFYDAANALQVVSSSLYQSNLALSGQVGTSPNEILGSGLLGPFGITRVVITGDPLGGSFALDNVSYRAAEVPEPASARFALFGLAILIVSTRPFRSRTFGAKASLLITSGGILHSQTPSGSHLIKPPMLSPAAVSIGGQGRVSVSALVMDPENRLILTSVQAVLSGQGQASIVPLNDDGNNGDAEAGDRYFGGSVNVDTSVIRSYSLTVTAAFRGELRRRSSTATQLEVRALGVPTKLDLNYPDADLIPGSEQGQRVYCNRVSVAFRPGTTSAQVHTLVASLGASLIGWSPELGVYQLKLSKCTADTLGEIVTRLRANPSVRWAHPDTNGGGQLLGGVPANDPYIGSQWYLDRIRAREAWNYVSEMLRRPLQSARIGIIDSGVRYDHEDLVHKSPLFGTDFCAWKRSKDGPCFADDDPLDEHGHGTAVAGLAAALSNNGIGVASVSYNSRIMFSKVNHGSSPLIEEPMIPGAIIQAVRARVRVINCSWSARPHPFIEDAIRYAIGQGVLVVVAAGNYNSQGATYPASLTTQLAGDMDGVVSVGASDQRNNRSVWTTDCEGVDVGRASNYGPTVDLYAPGSQMFVLRRALSAGASAYSQVCAGGTSFAAPLVTGTAALMLGANDNLQPFELKQILRSTSSATGNLEKTPLPGEVRMLDALAAVREAIARRRGLSNQLPTAGFSMVTLGHPIRTEGQIVQVTVPLGQSPMFTLDGSRSSDPDIGDSVVSYEWTDNGSRIPDPSFTGKVIQVPLGAGVHTINLRVKDSRGASSAIASARVTVSDGSFSFALDSLTASNNPLYTDSYDDGLLTAFPTSALSCVAGDTPVESGGFLLLRSQDVRNNFSQSGASHFVTMNCSLGQSQAAFRMRAGGGNSTVTAAFRADRPVTGQSYGLQFFTRGANELVNVQAGYDAITALVTPSGGSTVARSTPLNLAGAGRVYLRLTYDDASRTVSAFYSTNGTTFTSLALPTTARLMTAGSEAHISVFGSVLRPGPVPGVIELPTLGGTESMAFGISSTTPPSVAGVSTTAAGLAQATLWTNGVPVNLGSLGHSSEARGISPNGQFVTGFSRPNSGSMPRAFSWRSPGPMVKLIPDESYGNAVNDLGYVAGQMLTGGRHRAFVDQLRGPLDIGTFGGNSSNALAISPGSVVAGWAQEGAVFGTSGFRWTSSGTPAMLAIPNMTQANAVNTRGDIAGFRQLRPSGQSGGRQAMLYRGGTTVPLGDLPYQPSNITYNLLNGANPEDTLAYGINAAGIIVGTSRGNATMWRGAPADTTAINLNTLLPAGSGWILVEARAINDAGYIVGTGYRNGRLRGFLLNPVP